MYLPIKNKYTGFETLVLDTPLKKRGAMGKDKILRFTIIVCFLVFLLIFTSCRSYYTTVKDYHKKIENANYLEAATELKNSRFLSKKDNKILLNLELGKMYHLQQKYYSSNYYFNQADLLMEEKSIIGDITTSVLINEAATRYKGEDFERVLVNYYKALNYLYLNKNEDALIEAKRINIRINELSDKQLFDGKKYKTDAFANNLQGFIYERMRDYNNAFIAYRNAYEAYETKDSGFFMGTTLPQQLKIDLINSAHKAGFHNEADFYCSKFNLQFNDVIDTSKNQLIVIWENGLVPIKQQETINLYLVKGSGGVLNYTTKSGDINIPFSLPSDKQNISLKDLNVVRIAYPTYVDVPLYFNNLSITCNAKVYDAEPVENISYIAKTNLTERFLKEITLTASRISLKKITEAELKKISKEQEKKGKDNEAIAAAIGSAVVTILGYLTEKADTRNWQSLPSMLSYARIPINKGENSLSLTLRTVNNTYQTHTLNYNATSGLNLINYNTLQHLPIIFK